MKELVFVGAGGHARACADVVEQLSEYSIVGILDRPDKVGTSICGYSVTGTDEEIEVFAARGVQFLLTVGQIQSTKLRVRLHDQIVRSGGELPVIISPLAHCSSHAKVREGTILMHRALVNAGASVGRCCILNTGSIVEHDAVIGDFCHISTNAVVNGGCSVGDRVFVGSGAVLVQEVRIASDVIIGAQSVVTIDCLVPGTYIGNPARLKETAG